MYIIFHFVHKKADVAMSIKKPGLVIRYIAM